MSARRYLLDTSAILTLIEDEDGAPRVEQVLREQDTFVAWTSLLEVYDITRRERGSAEAEQRYALLKALTVTLLWAVDEPTLLLAGRLKADHHVSLADAIIAAHARQQEAVILHKDPEFEALAGLVELEALPYKLV
ncbi:MAG: PIN domain-containing protein [Anaerolineae bacterium]